MKNIFCHRKDFSSCFVTRNIFHVGQSNFFPVTQGVFPVRGFVPSPMCSNSIFPVTRNFYCEKEVLVILGVLHFRDKCAGFTIKISRETIRDPGNLVPRFPMINLPRAARVEILIPNPVAF